MRRIGFTILCLVVILGVTSCEDEQFPDSGQAISFASLSGQLVTRGTPIDANADIPNMGVFAYYTGNGLSNNWAAQGATAAPAFMNNVQVTNNSGIWSYANPVYWPTANDANVSFFAYSPYATGNMGNGITVNISTGIPTITYTVPTSCAAQPDLMVATLKKDLNKVSGSPVVSFELKHALTGIGFKASGQGEEITGIKITDVITSGVLTTLDDGSSTWNTSSSGTDDFEAIPNGATLDGTSAEVIEANGYLMMIPQTLGANSKLILTLSDNSEVEFDINGHTWAPGTKVIYNIALSSEDILIVTESLLTYNNNSSSQTFTVTSTTGSGTAKSWTADFSTDNGVTWTPTCPAWLTIPTSGPGGTNIPQTATLSAYAGDNTEDLILAAAAVKGSPSTPYDLSTKGGSTSMNTANCYIINSPGHYQLPLVFGNAIKNGATNTSAYSSSSNSLDALKVFLRHDDNPITDPYLYGQTDVNAMDIMPDNAVLVWEDTLGLITNIDLTLDRENLTFEVSQATIAQGNAILAVRNWNFDIIWSWHIWVTPLVNAETPATDEFTNTNNYTYNFMQHNLGWCTIGSTPRSVMVRITQDGTSLSDTIIISQSPSVLTSGGFAPYWQWGRKDPMPPSTGYSNSDNTLFFGSGYNYYKRLYQSSIGYAIQNPNETFNTGSNDWCSQHTYHNLWNVNNTVLGQSDNLVVKTVYDPSPAGFTIPASNAWMGFSSISQVEPFNAGWTFQLPNTNIVFYPAAGIRNNGGGTVSSVGIGGYFWTAFPSGSNNSRTVSFVYNTSNYTTTINTNSANSSRPTSCSVRCVLEK